MLLGRRPPADRAEHLRPSRARCARASAPGARSHRREHHVRPGREPLQPEAAADERVRSRARFGRARRRASSRRSRSTPDTYWVASHSTSCSPVPLARPSRAAPSDCGAPSTSCTTASTRTSPAARPRLGSRRPTTLCRWASRPSLSGRVRGPFFASSKSQQTRASMAVLEERTRRRRDPARARGCPRRPRRSAVRCNERIGLVIAAASVSQSSYRPAGGLTAARPASGRRCALRWLITLHDARRDARALDGLERRRCDARGTVALDDQRVGQRRPAARTRRRSGALAGHLEAAVDAVERAGRSTLSCRRSRGQPSRRCAAALHHRAARPSLTLNAFSAREPRPGDRRLRPRPRRCLASSSGLSDEAPLRVERAPRLVRDAAERDARAHAPAVQSTSAAAADTSANA